MDETMLYHALIVIALGLSVVLVIFSSAAGGRKLADRDVMHIAGINGVRSLEISIKLRIAFCRLVLGLAFGVVCILTFIPESAPWRGWFGRIALVGTLGLFSFASVKDWIDDQKQLRLVASERDVRMATIEARASEHAGQQGAIHPADHTDRHTEHEGGAMS